MGAAEDKALAQSESVKVQEDSFVHAYTGGSWQRMAAEDKALAQSESVMVQEDKQVSDAVTWLLMAAEDQTLAQSESFKVQEDRVPDDAGRWYRMAAEDKALAQSESFKVQEDRVPDDATRWGPMAAEDQTLAQSESVKVQEDKQVLDKKWPLMAAEDKVFAHHDGETDLLTVPGKLLVTDVKLWVFDSVEVMEQYVMKNARGVAWKANASHLHRDVRLLSKDLIPHQNVILSCHYHDPAGPMCHVPFVSETFWQTRVQFLDDMSTADLIFTEHKIHPLCKTGCEMKYHVAELLLLSGQPVIV